MDLHMVEFDGVTFGMDVQDKAAFKRMKKNAFYKDITPKGWQHSKKVLCVKAEDLAQVMGTVGWLVSEGRYMKTVRWGDSPEHFVIYEDEEDKR